MDDHIKLVQKVVDRLEQHDLAVSLTKSVFNQDEVEFLGYIVKTRGVTMSARKVKSVETGHTRDQLKKFKLSFDSETSIGDSSKISRRFASQ